ncbi:MAG: Single-stranded DNA-binding protein [Candidatus Shapirobacteria bacterium GW2011_GWE1_38_10]|uniref:Single-stranded DNA-binding protein n=1 Tax=Candidatus Shapirobacteria bacterium GW2011_GWE1_38_10 TaxID=1618488 RepID=A0A0G0KMQ6_9BACT|nr:MAG: Single-stranded DNA-binding protein [Candidatus Shapirobacteria bacterium GW2011_GWF2_37_20]KKQ50449.1 MAG: Single-stranded DNA-binding protein [Candidatus Shapirobacteria bacterium GW2011_GWE1_38_10]KKQ65105.1 MAG: Single-stranded DNA-binding protein [Candidatus Shapirobacteria bacterium GW2011_GWF1_38_23]HBP50862.1 single-stranded DNA-binding protein [Candidatus Shapirobacteria bacterium]
MPSRCLNQVMLIGNLTRDPELRYTPAGMAVVSFGLATNRVWITKQGEKKEDAQFHRIVAWNKLAELCSQLLSKGRRVYVEGRIQYREITDAANLRKQVSEIVIEDMIVLDNKGVGMATTATRENAVGTVAEEEIDLNNGAIEDIVIPDDIATAEVAPEVPVEEKAGEDVVSI